MVSMFLGTFGSNGLAEALVLLHGRKLGATQGPHSLIQTDYRMLVSCIIGKNHISWSQDRF